MHAKSLITVAIVIASIKTGLFALGLNADKNFFVIKRNLIFAVIFLQ